MNSYDRVYDLLLELHKSGGRWTRQKHGPTGVDPKSAKKGKKRMDKQIHSSPTGGTVAFGREGGVKGTQAEKDARKTAKKSGRKLVAYDSEHSEFDAMRQAKPGKRKGTSGQKRAKKRSGGAVASARDALFRGRGGDKVKLNRRAKKLLRKRHGIKIKRGVIPPKQRQKAADVLHPEDSGGRERESAISRENRAALKDRAVAKDAKARGREQKGQTVVGPQGGGSFKKSKYARGKYPRRGKK